MTAVVKPQDILVLLKIGLDPDWSFPQLSEGLGFSVSALHRSLQRAAKAGLYDPKRRVVRSASLSEFLRHGLKFVFPPAQTGETRGIPTAWASPRLESKFAPSDSLPLVWPHPLGSVRGIGLEPLHPAIPDIARRDPELGERLALIDALRLGDARLAQVAGDELDGLLGVA
jgi:hypothetical protein